MDFDETSRGHVAETIRGAEKSGHPEEEAAAAAAAVPNQEARVPLPHADRAI
jgi:hypothetical protein